MHLISFILAGKPGIGAVDWGANELIDLSDGDSEIPNDMLTFIAMGDAGLRKAAILLASKKSRHSLADVTIVAPIPRPARNVLCVGKNYRDHVNEVQSIVASAQDRDAAPPVFPIIFTKATTTVVGPGASVSSVLDPTDSVDYEGELAVVIGEGGRDIPRAEVMQHIYGYTIVNDLTSRRLQKRHHQWFLGKSLDGFCPMGPSLVTRDEITDVTALCIQTHVNGELRQNGYVREMIFDIPTLIETISSIMTLQSGDIIATGTPAGVGMGFTPPRYLKPGDVVAVTINPIGVLENTVL